MVATNNSQEEKDPLQQQDKRPEQHMNQATNFDNRAQKKKETE